MDKVLNDLKEMLEDELKKITKKNDISPAELDNATKAVCLIEKIRKLENPDYGEGYAEGYAEGRGYMPDPRYMYEDRSGMTNGSYARGRSPVTGRYISRGYSGHSIKDRMIAKLEDMYDEAKTDHEKQTVDMWIKRLEGE